MGSYGYNHPSYGRNRHGFPPYGPVMPYGGPGGPWRRYGYASEAEGFGDQVKEFVKAAMEMSVEFGRVFRDIVWQTLGREDSFVGSKIKRFRGPSERFLAKFGVLNKLLPEDKDPIHVLSVFCFVFVLAFAGNVFVILYSVIWNLSVGC